MCIVQLYETIPTLEEKVTPPEILITTVTWGTHINKLLKP